MNCIAMYALTSPVSIYYTSISNTADRNERQRERSGRLRASSAPEARERRCYMAILIIYRVPREFYAPQRRAQRKEDYDNYRPY